MRLSWSFLLLAAATYRANAAATLRRSSSDETDVKISIFTPQGSALLVPTLLSFSLEQDRWPDWTGTTERNQFTFNALTNFAKFTGHLPKIRVGANSEDKTKFDPSVNVISTIFPNSTAITPYPEATNISVSDGYYALAKWMPEGTHMIWGLNLGYDDAQNAVNLAQSIMRAFSENSEVTKSGVVLDYLELGNEPDLYAPKIRPAGWTVSDYVADWIKIMTPVVQAINLSAKSPVSLLGCSFAGQGFTPEGVFANGLLDSEPGKLVTQISQHRYSAFFCQGGTFQLSSFMSKAAIRGNLTIFNTDIAAVKAMGLGYILGETNSIACHGAPGVSNTAGAALWTLDYTLQAASLGITEVFFHEGIGFKYDFFQPIALNRSPVDNTPLPTPLPPHVQPSYYAGIIITTAVGSKAASGQTKIIELQIDEDNVSGYAIYEHGVLVRAVFINLSAFQSTDQGNRTRQSTHISFDFRLLNGAVATSPKTTTERGEVGFGEVQVQRLNIRFADDTAGLTWNGQSYETPDGLVSGETYDERVGWWEGIDIVESEAVMVSF